MSCASEFVPQLRSRGFRMTPQRMVILHVLHHERIHLSPVDIYKKARHELPGITEPTVYRTLDFLAQNGIVRTSNTASGRLTYEIAGDDHHHVTCRECGSDIELKHTVLETIYKTLETASGFNQIDSHMSFFGLCPNCQSS
ncbi:MAG TPA: transcriptional repressor [Anaerolineae bacterium]|nr:transcriptional repressor [Anaerolineae bacterium]